MIDEERLKRIKYLSKECERTVDTLSDYYEDLKDELDVAIDETEDTLYKEKFCTNRKKATIVFNGRSWGVFSGEKDLDNAEIGSGGYYDTLNGSHRYVDDRIFYEIKKLISENYEITFERIFKESD